MIYSILYILLNVTLYIDIGVVRALYVAVAAHSKKPARRLPRLVPSLVMTMYGINLAMTVDSVWPARRSFVTLRMT